MAKPEKTKTPDVFRRGTVYYGRLRVGNKSVWKRLSDDYAAAKELYPIWKRETLNDAAATSRIVGKTDGVKTMTDCFDVFKRRIDDQPNPAEPEPKGR